MHSVGAARGRPPKPSGGILENAGGDKPRPYVLALEEAPPTGASVGPCRGGPVAARLTQRRDTGNAGGDKPRPCTSWIPDWTALRG